MKQLEEEVKQLKKEKAEREKPSRELIVEVQESPVIEAKRPSRLKDLHLRPIELGVIIVALVLSVVRAWANPSLKR